MVADPPSVLGWRPIEDLPRWGEQTAAGLRCYRFPGGHFFFKDAWPAFAQALVDELRPHLDAASPRYRIGA